MSYVNLLVYRRLDPVESAVKALYRYTHGVWSAVNDLSQGFRPVKGRVWSAVKPHVEILAGRVVCGKDHGTDLPVRKGGVVCGKARLWKSLPDGVASGKKPPLPCGLR